MRGLGSPVIFTTAFDQFVLDAFQAQAIDYLLNPIDEQRLAQAFAKYGRMQRHFTAGAAADLRALADRLARPPGANAWSAAGGRSSSRCRWPRSPTS